MADGSATIPGLPFSIDINTGFFRPATDTLGIAGGGSEIVRIGPNGISFDGGSEWLDDYEEGSWTPSYGGSTTNPSVTYSLRSGTYVRVGNVVHVWGQLRTSSISSSGSGELRITGLPFTNGIAMWCAGSVSYSQNWATDNNPVTVAVRVSSAEMTMYHGADSDWRDGITGTLLTSDLSNTANGNWVIFAASYYVA